MLVYILSLVLKAILSEIIYLVEFMEGSIIQQESEREKGIKMLQELPLQSGWCVNLNLLHIQMLIASDLNDRLFRQNLLSTHGWVYFYKVVS